MLFPICLIEFSAAISDPQRHLFCLYFLFALPNHLLLARREASDGTAQAIVQTPERVVNRARPLESVNPERQLASYCFAG